MPSIGRIELIHCLHQSVVLIPVGEVEHIPLHPSLRADVGKDHPGTLVGVALAEELPKHRDGLFGQFKGAVSRDRQLHDPAFVVLREALLMDVGQNKDDNFAAHAILRPQLLRARGCILGDALMHLLEVRYIMVEGARSSDLFLGRRHLLEANAGLTAQFLPHAKADHAHPFAHPFGR